MRLRRAADLHGLVYAATLNNTVYALDQATGLLAWSTHVGAPQTGGWVCGNVSPTGILGTPVIDTAASRIYAVAEIAGATPAYHLSASTRRRQAS
ncbi:MAG: hypothetical protein ACYDAL_18690 [Candidatus Dormibacteraceae bacterium]